MHSMLDLRQFQWAMQDFADECNARCGWYAGMGAGKTVTAYTYLQTLLINWQVKRPLIVSTKINVETTWRNEISQWEHLHRMTTTAISGSMANRKRALNTRADFTLCSYSALKWLCEQFTEDTWPFDIIVFDESSKLKDPQTMTFKKFVQVGFRNTRNVILMSGSPAAQGHQNLWAQMLMLDGGAALGDSYPEFIKEYFKVGYLKNIEGPREGAEQEIREAIKGLAVFIDPNEFIPTHERIDVFHEINLPPKTQKIVKRLETDFFLSMEHLGVDLDTVDMRTVEVANAGVLHGKLLQACNGFLYPDDREEMEPIQLHNLKLDVLEGLREQSEVPLIVAANFKEDIRRIKQRFPDAEFINSTNAAKMQKRFNEHKVSMLVGNPKSMGHGLNLQFGSNVGVWYGMSDSVEDYLQFNERFGPIRQAQSGLNRGSIVHHIVGKDTREERVMKRMAQRIATQGVLLDSLKDHDRFKVQE